MTPAASVSLLQAQSVSHASLFIAEARGYFRDEGLSITTQATSNASDALVMLNSGDVDFVPTALGAAMLNASSVLDFRILMSMATIAKGDASSSVLVRKDLVDSGAYRTVADLKGRKFALFSADSMSGYISDRTLRLAGLSIADVEPVVLSYPDMAVALTNGAVDAAQIVEPFCTILRQSGVADIVAPSGDVVAGLPSVLLLASTDLLARRGEVAQRMVRAVLRGMRDYHNAVDLNLGGREEILTILSKNTPIKDPKLLGQIGLPHIDPNGRFDLDAVDRMQDYFVSRGVQPRRVDLNAIMNHDVIDAVLGRVGLA